MSGQPNSGYLPGATRGKLTLLARLPGRLFSVRCDCGVHKEIREETWDDLKSCGCAKGRPLRSLSASRVEGALTECNGSRKAAARLLGCTAATIRYYAKKSPAVARACASAPVAAATEADPVKRELARRAEHLRKTLEYQERNPKKTYARLLVQKRLRQGLLARSGCQLSSAECRGRVEGHHDDYNAPLEVRWLCRRHHQDWHMLNGEAANADGDLPTVPELHVLRRRPVNVGRYIGVVHDKLRGKWSAYVCHSRKRQFCGRFATEEDAARAIDRKLLELFGDAARLNFPTQRRTG